MAEADVLRVILSLVAVVLLLLGVAWLTRRAGLLRTGNTRAIQVLSMQNLGGRGYLALVQVENTRLVLGITATQINVLHTLEEPFAAPENGGKDDGVKAGADTGLSNDCAAAHTSAPKSPSHRFAQVLGKALKGR